LNGIAASSYLRNGQQFDRKHESICAAGDCTSIPLLDTSLTIIRRGILQRRSLFAAERGHIHHRFLDIGLCHAHTVLLLNAVSLGGAVVGLICIFAGGWVAGAAAVLFGCGLAILFRAAGSVRAGETINAVRRNRAIGRENRRYLAAFYDLQLRFREARTVDGWWEQLCRAADVLDFAKVDVPLTRRDGTTQTLKWRRSTSETVADAQSITAEVPIPQRRTDAAVRAQVEVTIKDFLEIGGHRVALFSRLMCEFGLDKLRSAASRPGAGSTKTTEDHSEAHSTDGPGVFEGLRVAIIHDFLYTYAGAERVLEQFVNVFPQAQLFSLFDFLPADQRGFIRNKPVKASFLQRMPFARTRHRAYLPLMPIAIEQLDLSKFDLVISSSYVAAKGVITRPDQLHVCYCHTPVRFAWDLHNQYLEQTGLTHGLRSILARVILHYIRSWDLRSAQGVDVFLTNSDYVGRRIQKLYRRKSITIYPPVDIDLFQLQETKEDFYLTASRMVPYKRIDLIVEAFARMPHRRLIVVGQGPEMSRIKAKAGPNITFMGHETCERLRRHMQLARAFVFAAEEDFGIAPVEAQASGTPVIAYGRGGATETVIEGVTGILFESQTVESLISAVERFEQREWNPARIRRHAEQFSAAQFREQITNQVRHDWTAFKAGTLLATGKRHPGRIMENEAVSGSKNGLPVTQVLQQLHADLDPMSG
jgi:glycosyltransferase involved in cell wall biosynthesis